jgi:MoaA/NifB/PqqE/SkfB family radical SAM enzyme
VRTGYSEYLKYLRYILTPNSTTPLYFIHSVTQKCTARCLHCFIKDEYLKKNDLSLEEIEKVSKSMDNFLFLMLTGGEPFLRDDLPEIARVYYKNNRVRKFQIPSNGSLGDQIVHLTKRILNNIPGSHLSVVISLDAVGEAHDRIRQSPGLFNSAVATYKKLKQLEKAYNNFNCLIGVTVSAFNQDYLPQLYRYLVSELAVDSIIYSIVRGFPRDTKAKDLNLDKLRVWNELVTKDIGRRLLGHSNFPLSDVVNAENFIAHKMNIQILRNESYIAPCFAARLAALMLSDGDVFPCEILLDKKLGNIRDCGYNFKEIWRSSRSEEIRNFIRESRCFCTHECFSAVNILFNASFLSRLFGNWLKIKYRRFISVLKKKMR